MKGGETLKIAVVEVPYQIFSFLRDHIANELNRDIEFNHRPSEDFLNYIDETICFIEAHDKFTHTDRIRALLEQAKLLPRDKA